uniref:Uncharacterized protein n=1 Tax=Vitis vinifera TaxID=29760 RepID=A5C9P7_VITVI|nr:hypothetical protein VITISV_035869 [Vitis vinifera]
MAMSFSIGLDEHHRSQNNEEGEEDADGTGIFLFMLKIENQRIEKTLDKVLEYSFEQENVDAPCFAGTMRFDG